MADQRESVYTYPAGLAGEIRRFYLLPEESYSLSDLAQIWRISLDDVCAIFSDELARAKSSVTDQPSRFRVSWADAVRAAHAFHVFRHFDIEVALGDEFERIRGSRWRTVPVLLHLPRCIVDALRLLPFIPPADSIGARAERLLCEMAEAGLVQRGMGGSP